MSRKQQHFEFFDAVRIPQGNADCGERGAPVRPGPEPEKRDEVVRLMALCLRSVARSICAVRSASSNGQPSSITQSPLKAKE